MCALPDGHFHFSGAKAQFQALEIGPPSPATFGPLLFATFVSLVISSSLVALKNLLYSDALHVYGQLLLNSGLIISSIANTFIYVEMYHIQKEKHLSSSHFRLVSLGIFILNSNSVLSGSCLGAADPDMEEASFYSTLIHSSNIPRSYCSYLLTLVCA